MNEAHAHAAYAPEKGDGRNDAVELEALDVERGRKLWDISGNHVVQVDGYILLPECR